ncbi:hypothetical protein [Aurantiacibacter sediminis]|uniref:DUF2259 domain-containing protein n=1 Tax=Aurantiacibacter sediminis TaxID=2793064 RepID=A0ABS0N670_9SPHN|nr:hypothetical protein [Aurantiacibacter sediminis]MBH5323317.1 hypothetical protein [Aurantiacibacter sediminis]
MKVLSVAAIGALLTGPAAQAQDSAWFDAIEGMSASEMGTVMLEGQEHGAIVRIEDRTQDMTPPGFRDYTLLERPERVGDACTRISWYVTLNTMDGGVSTHSARPFRQVALSREDPCEFADFATLAEEVSTDEAVAMLQLAADFEALDRPISCRDETDSGLCRSDNYTRMNVGYLKLNRIAHLDEGGYRLWMGQPFTQLEVPAEEDAPIVIHRRIPAPF